MQRCQKRGVIATRSVQDTLYPRRSSLGSYWRYFVKNLPQPCDCIAYVYISTLSYASGVRPILPASLLLCSSTPLLKHYSLPLFVLSSTVVRSAIALHIETMVDIRVPFPAQSVDVETISGHGAARDGSTHSSWYGFDCPSRSIKQYSWVCPLSIDPHTCTNTIPASCSFMASRAIHEGRGLAKPRPIRSQPQIARWHQEFLPFGDLKPWYHAKNLLPQIKITSQKRKCFGLSTCCPRIVRTHGSLPGAMSRTSHGFSLGLQIRTPYSHTPETCFMH